MRRLSCCPVREIISLLTQNGEKLASCVECIIMMTNHPSSDAKKYFGFEVIDGEKKRIWIKLRLFAGVTLTLACHSTETRHEFYVHL